MTLLMISTTTAQSIYTNSHPSKHKARLHFLLIFSMHTQMFLSIPSFIYFSLAFVFLTLQIKTYQTLK